MISKKADGISPFIVMDILERAAQLTREGRSIIHLEVGEPDFETPECIKEAAIRAIKDGKTHYTHSLGIFELREAIAEHYYEKYRVAVDPERIIVTEGTSPAMLMVFGVLLEPGDEVIVSNPCYACYANFINFTDGIPSFVNVYERDGFQYLPEMIDEAITERTKGIFINSPANPTGTLLSADRMKKLSEMQPYIVSDEIYHGLVYGEKEHSILEFTDRAFVLNGFSKTYAMTGWRLGYVIVPREFVRSIQKLQQNFFISANSFVQWAGIAALKEADDDVARMREIYNERRVYMIRRLKELGFGIAVEPTGAFYVFANVKKFTGDSYEFAFKVLEKAGVGVTPGVDFGDNAEGFIRFSYANSIENIKEGLDRLENFLKEIKA